MLLHPLFLRNNGNEIRAYRYLFLRYFKHIEKQRKQLTFHFHCPTTCQKNHQFYVQTLPTLSIESYQHFVLLFPFPSFKSFVEFTFSLFSPFVATTFQDLDAHYYAP